MLMAVRDHDGLMIRHADVELQEDVDILRAAVGSAGLPALAFAVS